MKMKSFQFPIALAPETLWQSINPWKFMQDGGQIGVVNIALGQTPHPEVEERVLDEVGSYGRQIGRIGDALEVLVRHVDLGKLTETEQDAIHILMGQLAQVRRVKAAEERKRAEGSSGGPSGAAFQPNGD